METILSIVTTIAVAYLAYEKLAYHNFYKKISQKQKDDLDARIEAERKKITDINKELESLRK